MATFGLVQVRLMNCYGSVGVKSNSYLDEQQGDLGLCGIDWGI